MTETDESFAARVLKRTGHALATLPEVWLKHGDTLPGHIMCSRTFRYGTQFVCGVGYPVETEEGEVFSEFVLFQVVAAAMKARAVQDEAEAEDYEALGGQP